jgi:hypothetical protein
MAWYRDPVLEGDEVSANTKSNCCLVTLVLGTIITGVMFKNYVRPRYLTAARMFGKILLPKRTRPVDADIHPQRPFNVHR